MTDEARASDARVANTLASALYTLRANKPSERSEKARRYAVTITEMEKVLAYFKVFALEDPDPFSDEQIRAAKEEL